jgi:eukaryotic-like serine/threonine-protein kinase
MATSSTDGATSARDTVDAVRAHFTRTRRLAPRSLPDHDPERIGRYSIRRRLGMGGMGVVYEAFDERVGRAVALKLLLPGNAEVERERLRREAQALARLSHPNVVEVFEIGEHHDPEAGEPPRAYVAMALVEGHSLDRWLRLRRRSLAEIVEVFVQAGEGLVAAHAHGLVHRDFKPGNVLVGNDGRVRVVDFGLVRESDVVEPSTPATERSVRALPLGSFRESLTRTGATVGTPAYMSPEQLLHLPLGPKSDQFAFCVALYEALFRQHPFVVGGEWTKLPFNVLDGAVARPPHDPRVPARLVKAVVRGLAVRPEERWPALDVLLSELRWALAPRGRRPLLTAVAVGITGIGLALLTPSVVLEPPDHCEDAATLMDQAWGSAAREGLRSAWVGTGRPSDADTWSRVEVRMQAYAEDWWAVHRAACAGPSRASSSAMCLARLADGARIRLQVMATPNEGVRDNAVQMFGELPPVDRCRAALDEQDPAPSDDRLDVPGWRELERVDALLDAGQLDEARAQLEATLDRAGRESNAVLLAEVQLRIGRVQLRTGNVEPAVKALEQAYLEAMRLDRDRLAAEAALSLLQLFGGRNYGQDDAARWARRARTAVERLDDPRLTSRFHHAWGRALHGEGDLEQALAEHMEGLALLRSLPDAADDEIATSLLAVSSTLGLLGRFDEGRRHAEQALELREAALGPRHPRVAASLMALGGLAFMEKKRVEALERYERALSIVQEHSPDDPVASFGVLLNISAVHRHDDDPQLAADVLRLFLDAVERAPEPEAVDPARVAWVRGEIAMLEQRYEEALVQYERAALGEEVQRYEETRGLLGVAIALYHLGRLEESVSVHRRVLELLEPKPGRQADLIDLHDRVVTLRTLARTLAALGEHEAALQELRLARTLAVALPHPTEAAEIDAELGAELVALGRSAEAPAASVSR